MSFKSSLIRQTVRLPHRAQTLRPTYSCDGRSSNDSDGTIFARPWDFGDGTTSDQLILRRQYTSLRVFTATLTSTDDDGLTASSSVETAVRTTRSNIKLSHGQILSIVVVKVFLLRHRRKPEIA
ncbi:PKD domain-containing protein [Rubripirellula reticaptiva]|uniref:Protease 1 n=1 Tax=Rubripirellula reticaptiva TaxID=2528013 RepID=A0A5C6ERY4_9BACT|nr:PKD domain-containing protein [Rubripirellula reticaptiva]TWU51395.1 Protease 1 precursor [Rubripirellula reticaptiva]